MMYLGMAAVNQRRAGRRAGTSSCWVIETSFVERGGAVTQLTMSRLRDLRKYAR
jgi:hypothetical protein